MLLRRQKCCWTPKPSEKEVEIGPPSRFRQARAQPAKMMCGLFVAETAEMLLGRRKCCWTFFSVQQHFRRLNNIFSSIFPENVARPLICCADGENVVKTAKMLLSRFSLIKLVCHGEPASNNITGSSDSPMGVAPAEESVATCPRWQASDRRACCCRPWGYLRTRAGLP